MIYNMIYNLTNGGGGVPFDQLTALPEDVASGKTFIGAGSEEVQTGTSVPFKYAWGIVKGNGSTTLQVTGLDFTPTMLFFNIMHFSQNNVEGSSLNVNIYDNIVFSGLYFNNIWYTTWASASPLYFIGTNPQTTMYSGGFTLGSGQSDFHFNSDSRYFWFASTLTE